MSEGKVEKGCLEIAARVSSYLIGAYIGGFFGMLIGKNIVIVIAFALGGSYLGMRVYRAWYVSMVRSQKNPIVVVVLFLLMALVLMVGLVFLVLENLK